ncbi:hypothetical protein CDL15_Pgr012745 [Punica granatum]|uniref:Uncharacterized protein n=1 Tax=Punica granatum TaxID=22663 RepID=A0A218XE99_PUNGR|nr:hypothetical protein CDL15_Pgr012745 [Punica granatum]
MSSQAKMACTRAFYLPPEVHWFAHQLPTSLLDQQTLSHFLMVDYFDGLYAKSSNHRRCLHTRQYLDMQSYHLRTKAI